MSHAIYSFLINVDPAGDDQALAAEALDAISGWAEKNCDDNNWYQEMALVTANGRTVSLCEGGVCVGGDSLGRDLAELPQGERWEWARLFALQCVANEFSLDDWLWSDPNVSKPLPDYWNDFNALQRHILDEVPQRLSAEGPLVLVDPPATEMRLPSAFIKSYQRNDLSRRMGLFLDSIRDGHPPFSTGGNPYCYRSFFAAQVLNPDHLAIVFLDIHT